MKHFKIRSVRALALEIGMKATQLNRISKGKVGLPKVRANALADKYNVSSDWLLYGKGEPPTWGIVPHGTFENKYEQREKLTSKPEFLEYKDNLRSQGIEFSAEATARIIKKVREVLDISQLELGSRIGITKDLLLKVEKGYRNVSMLTWVLAYHYLNNMPKNDFAKIKHLFEDEELLKGTGVDEDEDDEDYRRSGQTTKQLEWLQSIIDSQKTLIEQKDFIIAQLQAMQKK